MAHTLTSLLIIVATFHTVLRHAFFADVPRERNRIITATVGYLLLAHAWVQFYTLILIADPNAIQIELGNLAVQQHDTLMYYSLVTLTTQGYGDVIPISGYARIPTGLEGTLGTLYIAVLIASLVGRMRAS